MCTCSRLRTVCRRHYWVTRQKAIVKMTSWGRDLFPLQHHICSVYKAKMTFLSAKAKHSSPWSENHALFILPLNSPRAINHPSKQGFAWQFYQGFTEQRQNPIWGSRSHPGPAREEALLLATQAPQSSTEKMPEITSADQAERLLLQGQFPDSNCTLWQRKRSRQWRGQEEERAKQGPAFPQANPGHRAGRDRKKQFFILQNLPRASYDPFLGIQLFSQLFYNKYNNGSNL